MSLFDDPPAKPHFSNLALHDVRKVRIRRDPEHACIELEFFGDPEPYSSRPRAYVVINVWQPDCETMPELEVGPDIKPLAEADDAVVRE